MHSYLLLIVRYYEFPLNPSLIFQYHGCVTDFSFDDRMPLNIKASLALQGSTNLDNIHCDNLPPRLRSNFFENYSMRKKKLSNPDPSKFQICVSLDDSYLSD